MRLSTEGESLTVEKESVFNCYLQNAITKRRKKQGQTKEGIPFSPRKDLEKDNPVSLSNKFLSLGFRR